MNRPIYCFVFLGLPCFALAMASPGIRTNAKRDAAEDALETMAGERNSLEASPGYGGYGSSNEVPIFRYKRAPEDVTDGPKDGDNSAKPTQPADKSDEEVAPVEGEMTDVRWITYLFLYAIALLFLLLSAVVLFLAYYILSTRVLNKTTCKEIELQCRCDDCDDKGDDGC